MNPDSVFRTQRAFPCQPRAIYEAFERPDLLAAWWGPNGFRNEFAEFDFRPGGRWEFVMVGPDGTRHHNENRFVALHPDSRIVIRHESAPHFTLEVQLRSVAEGTQLTWTQSFDDAAVAAAVRRIVEPANEQNLDRLAALLGVHGSAPEA